MDATAPTSTSALKRIPSMVRVAVGGASGAAAEAFWLARVGVSGIV